ncbi:MAG: hypothetical protein ACLPN5_19745 [Roseiarcus sp.]
MSVDPIIAKAQQALAASLREAYYAGRGDAATSLKEKVIALIEELIAPPPHLEAAAPASGPEAAAETHEGAAHEGAPPHEEHGHEGHAPEGHYEQAHQG